MIGSKDYNATKISPYRTGEKSTAVGKRRILRGRRLAGNPAATQGLINATSFPDQGEATKRGPQGDASFRRGPCLLPFPAPLSKTGTSGKETGKKQCIKGHEGMVAICFQIEITLPMPPKESRMHFGSRNGTHRLG